MDNEQEITKYITELQPIYKLFANKVEELLKSILEAKKIKSHSISSREKDPAKLREKISREGKNYENPLDQVTDSTGARIIA